MSIVSQNNYISREIFESKNPHIIAEKIKYFYDNPNKIVEMGNMARAKIENKFTFDCVAKRIVNFVMQNHKI